jgi:hypothetical protein
MKFRRILHATSSITLVCRLVCKFIQVEVTRSFSLRRRYRKL